MSIPVKEEPADILASDAFSSNNTETIVSEFVTSDGVLVVNEGDLPIASTGGEELITMKTHSVDVPNEMVLEETIDSSVIESVIETSLGDTTVADDSGAPLFVEFVNNSEGQDCEVIYEIVTDDTGEAVTYQVPQVVEEMQVESTGEEFPGSAITYTETVTVDSIAAGSGMEVIQEAGTIIKTEEEEEYDEEMEGEAKQEATMEKRMAGVAKVTRMEVKDEEPKTAIECQRCFVLFFDEDEFEEHMVHFHNETERKYKTCEKWFCRFCSRYFASRLREKHQLTCPPKNNFQCSQCDVPSFDTKAKLDRHRKKAHEDCTLQCSTCQATACSKYALKVHMRVHTGYRPFICSVCSMSYPSKTSLNSHFIRRHTTDTPYECTMCDKKYKEKSVLGRHIQKYHMNIKRHFCSQCGKGFYDRKVMVSHFAQVHTDARPWPCSLCDMAYKLKEHLTRHMKNTHLGR